METFVPVVVFSLIGLAAVELAVRSLPPSERSGLRIVLIAGLAARLIVVAIFSLFPTLRLFHEDAQGYEDSGLALAAAWRGDGPPYNPSALATQNYGYYFFIAPMYYLLPFAPVAAAANAVIGTISIFMVYRLAREFFWFGVARRAAWLTAFVPSMVLWSSVALKDALVTLLIIICLFNCIRLKWRFSFPAMLGVILPVVAVQPIRFYMVYFLGFAVVVSLAAERGLRSVAGIYKQIAIIGAVLSLLAVAGFAGRFQEGTEFLSLQRVSLFRHGMATSAQSGFSQDVDISTPGRALAFLPVGVANLLLSPFPWQMTSLRALLAAPETIAWWLMFPAALRGFWFAMRRRWSAASPLFIFTITLTTGYSLIHGNVGSGFRQRAQIFVFLFIFAALGIYQRRCRRAEIDEAELLNGGLGA
jgi:hypothetical protein